MSSNQTTTSAHAAPYLKFPTKGGTHRFQPDQIIRLEAESNYTFIHFRNHKPILMAKVLSAYESILSPFGFIRTHRSHLVNSMYIRTVDRNGHITMADNSIVCFSRRKRKNLSGARVQNSTAA